jgi:hypothetical protein
MKLFFLFFFIYQLATASTEKNDSRWKKLMTLVNQEMKILESAKRKGVEIKYRMLELHSEKLKLIHEKNNKEFLESSRSTGSHQNKESFFYETRNYYNLTKEFGEKILKEEVKNSRKAEILYALALNSRDYGRDNITERYLLDVLSLTTNSKNSLRHHAETALADFYYNEKKFPEAIQFYKSVIKNVEDDWMTKHLFNLSWCYLKNRDFDKAIETIKLSYFESKKNAYINVKDQALENIGSFYVYAGKPLEGLEFYLDNEKDPLPYLLPMALKASDKGHEKETRKILDAAREIIKKRELHQHQEELLHTYLDFYRHYNRFVDHEVISRELVSYYKEAESKKEDSRKSILAIEFKDDAIEKIRTTAGFLQVKLSKDIKKDDSEFDAEELRIVLDYFDHLVQLDAKRKPEYLYFRAETYYSVNNFKLAAKSYVESVQESKQAKDFTLLRKSLNSLLALTGQEVLNKEDNKKYLIFTYSEHVRNWPRDEKSLAIYPKLIEIYLVEANDTKASEVISFYNKSYPENIKEQQVFMTKVLDQLIDKKNTIKLNQWISVFKNGFLSFSKETIEKTEIVLGNLLFMEYQDLAKNGQKLKAAKGFEGLYFHKLYPDKVKSQAAFFASMAYLELAETKDFYIWQLNSHSKMTETERLERRKEQLSMIERTYRLQDFTTSFKLSEFLLKHFCTVKDETQDRFFEVAVMTSLVEESASETERIVKDNSSCLKNRDLSQISLSQIYHYYDKKGDYYKLRSFVKRNSVEPFLTQYRYSIQKMFWEKSDLNIKESIKNDLFLSKNDESLNWLKEIDLFQKAQKDLEVLKEVKIWEKPVFDPEAFNRSLEAYLVQIQNFKKNYEIILTSNQTDLAILTSKIFIVLFEHVGVTIQSLSPKGMTKEVSDPFKLAMKDVSRQFTQASQLYASILMKVLGEKEILSRGGRFVSSINGIENPVFSFSTGLIMDKTRE